MRARAVRATWLACAVATGVCGGCVDLDSLLVGSDAGGGESGGLDASPIDGPRLDGAPLDTRGSEPVGADAPHDVAPTDVTVTDTSSTDVKPPTDVVTEVPSKDTGGPTGPPWWNNAYASREQLTVTNPGSQALAVGFQVGWPADVQALSVKSGSYDEVRLVRWDASSSSWTELSRVIDELGQPQEYIWARLAASIAAGASDGSYYLYFGNASPPAAPNDPGTVFDFFDTLGGSTLSASWASQGGYTGTGSELELATNQSVHTVSNWGPGNAVDFVLRDPAYAGRFWGGFQLADTFADNNPWVIWIARNVTSPAQIWPELTIDGSTIWAGTPQVTLTSSAVLYGVEWYGDRAAYRLSDTVQYSDVATAPYSTPLTVRFTNESANPIYVSSVRVRQAAYPVPTVTTGPVQP